MAEQERSIQLPSGGTWTLDINPSWGKVKNLGKDVDPSEVLALLTTRWSFVEPVSAAAVDARDLADVAAVLEVFNAELLPLFSRLGGSRSSA